MNAGIYGMTSGQGMAGRKLIGRTGKSAAASGSQYVISAISYLGLAAATVSPANGVRTKVLSISGAGVLCYLGIADTGGGSQSYLAEIYIDGARVQQVSWVHGSTSGYGPFLVGGLANASYPSIYLESLPFYASMEVFVTVSGVSANAYIAHLADIYE